MLKLLTVSLLAAMAAARGDGDGSSSANAYEVDLINMYQCSLTLFTYNTKSADGMNELRGELEFKTKKS